MQRADSSMPDDDIRRTINLLRVSVFPDGTFEMLESGIPISGTHTLGKDEAHLTIKKRLGEPVTSSKGTRITLSWQADGTLLLTDEAGFDNEPVRLTLKSQR